MSIDELTAALEGGETADFEAKAARGGLPADMWETYSAFANTQGGMIFLGLKKKDHHYEVAGVNNPEQRVKEIWDLLNNRQKVSANLLSESDVSIRDFNGVKAISIYVPQATRTQRPVFINNNPLTGTYKRNFEGDYRCSEEEVRRMMRDASDEPFDTRILSNFDLADLDSETIKRYRQRFAAQNPDHPWSSLDDMEFLGQLGAFGRGRATGKVGCTVAGLLMFGGERSIRDAFPNYHVDYQERLSADPDVRWTDRISLDGRWEANLYNYYFRTIGALTRDLKLPFSMKGLLREGDTHVHQALREALVNEIVHADYSMDKGPGLITLKERSRFMFVNPGRLRLPIEQYYQGGISDCRNPNIQHMFRMIQLGERAGSGVPKIVRAWQEQHWATPLVSENPIYDVTHLILPTVSTVPEEVLKAISERIGSDFRQATELEQTAMIMVESYGNVSNSDLQTVSSAHPADIGKALRALVERGWLVTEGRGRGAKYQWPEEKEMPSTLELFTESPGNSAHLVEDSTHLGQTFTQLNLSEEQQQEVLAVAGPARERGKLPVESMDNIIVRLCSITPMGLAQIARIVNRSPRTLGVHYLPRLIQTGRLHYGRPGQRNDPRQTYVAAVNDRG